MAAELNYAPEVEHDLAEGFAWYERRDAGLGDDFLRAVILCPAVNDPFGRVEDRYIR